MVSAISYLQGTEAEENNADVPVSAVNYSLRLAPKVEPSCPTSNTQTITDNLAGYVKIEPSWVCRLECL